MAGSVYVRRHARRRYQRRFPHQRPEPVIMLDTSMRGALSIFLKDEKGKVIGTLSGGFGHDRIADIDSLVVSSDYRRKGLGRKLVKRFEEEARHRGMLMITLPTEFESDAMKFWEAMDYVPGEEVIDGFIHMEKVL